MDTAPDRNQLQSMTKWEHESIKEYAQRWRDLAAQVVLPMTEREMITIMVDTLPTFYYEKLMIDGHFNYLYNFLNAFILRIYVWLSVDYVSLLNYC